MTDPETLLQTDNANGVTSGRIEGGSLGVTPDGAATYTLPLWVPAGRRGIQPELVLQYHSRGGNGSLGVGWSLSGIPQITRSRKTIADDGAEGPIRFDKTDPFSLDGERLVLVSGTHGVDGAEYRTKRDTFTKIILHDVDSATDGHILGPTWFEAFHKDGRVFVFGGIGAGDLGSRFEGMVEQFQPVFISPRTQTADGSYIRTPDEVIRNSVEVVHTLVRYAWSVCSISDRSGNWLLVYYDGYPSPPGALPVARDYVPTKILYTGSPVDGTPALRAVAFVWDDRPDPQPRFMSGLRLVGNKRLKELRMSGPNPLATDPSSAGLLRRYAFNYQTNSVSGRSLLTSVQEFDRFGVAKRPHLFEWELGQSSFHEIDTDITNIKTTPAGRSPLPGRLRVADFNGDGRDDILYVPVAGPEDPDFFYILLADETTPNGFSPPYKTPIRVPQDPVTGRVYVYPDPAGDFMNILVRDDTQTPGTPGSPTYRVYHAGIDRSGASGNIGSFWVFRGRDIFDPKGFVEGIVELADLDGDGLPDLLHGDTTGVIPSWSLRANLGGNLNFTNEQFVRVFPPNHYFANLDGGSATALLIDDSIMTGGDPRYSALQLQRQGTNISTTVALTTLLRDQQYIFADFTGSGLPSAFSLGNAAQSLPTLAENVGGSFATPMPFMLNLPQPPSAYTPALRVIDWDQDGRAELLARTRTAVQQNDPMFVLNWNGSGFSQITLSFTSSWQMPEELDIFEIFDYNGNGLDDIVMFSDGHLRVFVRCGNKADMMTAVVDGLGARTEITYAPISDVAVHTPGHGSTYPQRAITGKVWVVSEHRDDNGIGGVNTYRFQYEGAVEDVTGLGFLGFNARNVLHVETGITARTTYMPGFYGPGGIYPLLGLPTGEVTHVPLGNGKEHVTTTQTIYAVRPTLGHVPYFVVPISIVEENVENMNGIPTMPVRRRTVTQDMDAYGNVVTYSEIWSDGNRYSSNSTYRNDPTTWLIGLLDTITEQSTTPSGITQSRNRAYEYDAQGLLAREVIEPGPKGPAGYLPLGPQPDGVKTLYRSIDRYPNGNAYRIVEEEATDPAGAKRSTTFTYDDIEHIFPVQIDNDLGHHLKATYHAGLGVQTSFEDENGVRRVRQYDGFGRFRHEAPPDGNELDVHYIDIGGTLRVSVKSAAGPELVLDHDVLGRTVTQMQYGRDDGIACERNTKYDEFGRVISVSRPHFVGTPSVFDTYSYDTLGRITSRVGANGTSSTSEYRGEWIITTDGNQNSIARKVDNLDRVVFCTDRDAALVGSTPGPAGTTYNYGPFNQLNTVIDIIGNVTVRGTDRLGGVIDVQDPDRGHRAYRYNAFRNVEQEIQGNNQVTLYHYDAGGRLYWIQDVLDGDIQYRWDTAANGIGKVAQIAALASGVTMTHAYDSAGRLVTKAWAIDTASYAVSKKFDPVGRLAEIVFPQVAALSPFSVTYEYGKFGQLLRALDGASRDVFWLWINSDASGLFGEEGFGNGLVDSWIEDPNRPGVLKSIQSTNSAQSLVRNLLYGFDANLNMQKREDQVLGTNEKFEYDRLDRLRRWTWKGAPGMRRIRWDYDDIGNLKLRKVEAGPGSDFAYTYNSMIAGPHAVVATTLGPYSYDLRGNQISAPGRTVTYGRNDLPTQIVRTGGKTPGTINFLYDGEISRVRAVDQTTGITADTLKGFYEFRYPNSKHGPNGEHVFTVSVNGRPVAQKTWIVTRKALQHHTTHYLHGDHQGSIDLVTNAKATAVERLKYDPFGRRVSALDPATQPGARKTDVETGYTGHEHVEGWDLIDMRGRFYDPMLAKFLSADPFVPNPLNPQAWNRYAYVLNNPLSLRDPTGFDVDEGDPEEGHSLTQAPASHSPSSSSRYRSTVRAERIENGQTVWTPGITSLQGCLADTKCTEAHVITRPGGDVPPPPQPPPKNDDGLAPSGLPPSAGAPPSTRMNSNALVRDPAELLLRLDRQRARTFQVGAPFANPARNTFHNALNKTLIGAITIPYALATSWAYAGLLVEEGASGSLILQSNKWVNLSAILFPLHHIFPWKFIEEFTEAGINIHLFTVEIPQALHIALHGEWNYLWEAFFAESGGLATAEEIAAYGALMMERWGLAGLPWRVWPRR